MAGHCPSAAVCGVAWINLAAKQLTFASQKPFRLQASPLLHLQAAQPQVSAFAPPEASELWLHSDQQILSAEDSRQPHLHFAGRMKPPPHHELVTALSGSSSGCYCSLNVTGFSSFHHVFATTSVLFDAFWIYFGATMLTCFHPQGVSLDFWLRYRACHLFRLASPTLRL